jgi:hypothetical protein
MYDGLTQGTKAISLSLHLAIVVTDAEVSLLQRAEPGVELQNTRRAVAEELSLDCKPRLVCGLHRLPNDLREFGGDGAEDHNIVQSIPIDGHISNVRKTWSSSV